MPQSSGQPSFGGIPAPAQSVQQPFGGVPTPTQSTQQPFGGTSAQNVQPSYIPPSNYGPVTPVKKSNKTPIIIACCAAAAAILAVVLFVFVIPNLGGKGGLKHRWSAEESGVTLIYDFKENVMVMESMLYDEPLEIDLEWEVEGDDRLAVTISMFGQSETMHYTYSLSSNGKTLTLIDENGSSADFTKDD